MVAKRQIPIGPVGQDDTYANGEAYENVDAYRVLTDARVRRQARAAGRGSPGRDDDRGRGALRTDRKWIISNLDG